MHGQGGVCEGTLYHCFWAGKPSDKKQQKYNTLWPLTAARDYVLHTTTNQKHSGVAKEEMKPVRSSGGAQFHHFGVD
jgi:hypothetical protein